MERRDDGTARAINVIHRPWCGSHGALRLYGDNDTSTRPSTDWRGRPCGMRLSGGRRYRWGYDAVKLTAARSTINKYLAKKECVLKISGKEAYYLMLREFPDIMNINEMCKALSVSTKTGYKLLQEGKINAIKVGRTYRIPKVHVLAYLKIVTQVQTA